MNYSNVAYDLLPYNMASATLTIESNSKWCHCHLMYTSCLHHFRQYEVSNEWDISVSRICYI